MARYKGHSTDLFKAEAKYNTWLKETKTVTNLSTHTFHSDMNLTVDSGTLEIKAQTLDETTTGGINRDIDPVKNTWVWAVTHSDIGGNINMYGVFLLSCVSTNSIGYAVVTSNGTIKWQNLNRYQLLITAARNAHGKMYQSWHKTRKIMQGITIIRNKFTAKNSKNSKTN